MILAISRVLVLDYYDGPRSGVLSDSGGAEYNFTYAFEDPETGARTFCLAQLTQRVLERIEGILAPHLKPDRTVWVPMWRFPTPEHQAFYEKRMDEVLNAAASPYTLQLSTANLGMGSFEVTPVSRNQRQLLERSIQGKGVIDITEWIEAGYTE